MSAPVLRIVNRGFCPEWRRDKLLPATLTLIAWRGQGYGISARHCFQMTRLHRTHIVPPGTALPHRRGYPYRVVADDPCRDLVLVSFGQALRSMISAGLPFLTVEACEDRPAFGDTIYVMGYPEILIGDRDPLRSRMTSKRVQWPANYVGRSTDPLLKRQAGCLRIHPYRVEYPPSLRLPVQDRLHGLSGGPVLDDSGRPIGVTQSQMRRGQAYTNRMYFRPLQDIVMFLATNA